MTISGIILAGGRGTRMGPLAAQISKALTSIGQRPHLMHQLDLMWRQGIEDLVVVVSPDTRTQISDCLHRCGWGTRVKLVVQPHPRGPVEATHIGLEESDGHRAVVLMADTYISELPDATRDFVGVAPAPSDRPFCFYDTERGTFVDGLVHAGTDVTIGLYAFDTERASHASWSVLHAFRHANGEIPMSHFLNEYADQAEAMELWADGKLVGRMGGIARKQIPSWRDTGDIAALARMRRDRFITREHHELLLDESGMIVKKGEGIGFAAQKGWMTRMNANRPMLVPRVVDVGLDWYAMEYVDLPTLSELFLYWPGRPDTWVGILDSIVTRLRTDLWRKGTGICSAQQEQAYFVDKAKSRLEQAGVTHLNDKLEAVRSLFDGDVMVDAHGDLNWNNILYSLNTEMFKLIDPRGDPRMPLSYELAKLAYSYDAGFSAITHDLIADDSSIMAIRTTEAHAMNEYLHQWIEPTKLKAAQACILLAAVPLHSERQGAAMIVRGMEMLDELV